MAAFGPSNVVARRAIDEIAEFSGETETSKYIKVFILQEIVESRRFIRTLCNEAQGAKSSLAQVNAMIAEMEAMNSLDAEEEITTLEAHLEIMDAAINSEFLFSLIKECKWKLFCSGDDDLVMLYDEVVVYSAHSEEESFVGARDFYFGLRVTLSKHQMLIAELEALGEQGDALRSLDYVREIIAHDSAKLGVLEQLLACTHVGIPLKAGYVADMEEKE
nr:hypothetical protein [Tanacetum cinerariifolium]